MKKIELYMPSTSHADQLHVIVWQPEENVQGIIQISHGMIEHINRYDRFARFMADKGFLVIGNDHLGHGETAAGKKFGYFTPQDGSRYVVRDLHRVSLFIKRKYPDVPFFLLGHSMGSFMARRYAMTYGKELDGLIIMGTGDKPEWLLKLGRKIIRILTAVKGEEANSWLMEKLCFSLYNRRCRPVRTPSDWLSRDEKMVDAYRKDKYCTFTFTLNGYRTLFEVLSYIQKRENIRKLPRALPMLFLSGDEDPVGNYGHGVKRVVKSYRRRGIMDITCLMYHGARHELLNEREYDKTQDDIWKWISERWDVS